MGTIRKRGNRYYVDFRADGERSRMSAGKTKRDAEEALRVIEGEVARGKFNLPKKERIKFTKFSSHWLETHSKAKNKSSTYRANFLRLKKHLVPFFGDKFLDGITPLLIDQFIGEKKSEISPATINRCLSLLSKILNDAVRWGYLRENPSKLVSKLDEPEQGFSYLKAEQVKSLLENATPVSKPILMFALYTGMRKGEILALRWEHIDCNQRIITVEETTEGSTKSKKVRYVPINPNLLVELRKWKLKSRSEYVFPGPDGNMRKDFRDALENALKRAGLPRIRVHDLRHTFAANFMMSGGNILSLQKILGHSTLQMTMRYAHLAPELLHKEMEKINLGLEREAKISPLEAASGVQFGSGNFGQIDSNSKKFGHKMGTLSQDDNHSQEAKSPNPLISLVPGEGFEPSRGKAPGDFKSPASTIPPPGQK